MKRYRTYKNADLDNVGYWISTLASQGWCLHTLTSGTETRWADGHTEHGLQVTFIAVMEIDVEGEG